MKSWILTPERIDQDMVISLPEDLIEETKWLPGDILRYHQEGDAVIIRRVPGQQIVDDILFLIDNANSLSELKQQVVKRYT